MSGIPAIDSISILLKCTSLSLSIKVRRKISKKKLQFAMDSLFETGVWSLHNPSVTSSSGHNADSQTINTCIENCNLNI